MIISGKELKQGMVITEGDFDSYYNRPEGLNDFYLVLGLDSSLASKNLEKLKEKVKSNYVTRDDLVREMKNLYIDVIGLGSLYVNPEKLSDCDKFSLQYLKATLLKILNNSNDIKPMSTRVSYDAKKFFVLDGLCIKEQDMNAWLLKKKLVDKNATSYVSLKEYTETALKIISCKESDFTFNEKLQERICCMMNGTKLQKVTDFQPGELILRITAKRARLLLVLGKTPDQTTYILEIENGTHKDFSSSYFSHNYLNNIIYAFKRNEKEVANMEYFDTGFNVYDKFKDNITEEIKW